MGKYAEIMQELAAIPGRAHPATEIQIEEIEREIGCRLPEGYRDFLRDYGGFFVGVWVLLSKPTAGGEDAVSIASFQGILPGDERDLLLRYQWDRAALPPELLTIASGDNGYICLSVAGDNKESVYFWASREGDDPHSYKDMYLLASSFDEFLNLIAK